MKLATTWASITQKPISPAGFQDEVEDVDEVDEEEDVWGAVRGGRFVLTAPHTSNKMLHELARAVRGEEIKRSKNLSTASLRRVFERWEAKSTQFLRPGHDYWTEFLSKLDCVAIPEGQSLTAAFERAKRASPPEQTEGCRKDLQLFACLCRELQKSAGNEPIMLDQTSIADLFGHSHHRNVSNWIRALKTLGLLELAERHIPKKRSARYFYTEDAQ